MKNQFGRCRKTGDVRSQKKKRISANVADIRSFHGTQWSENLGEHLALAKREPDIVLLADVRFFFLPNRVVFL